MITAASKAWHVEVTIAFPPHFAVRESNERLCLTVAYAQNLIDSIHQVIEGHLIDEMTAIDGSRTLLCFETRKPRATKKRIAALLTSKDSVLSVGFRVYEATSDSSTLADRPSRARRKAGATRDCDAARQGSAKLPTLRLRKPKINDYYAIPLSTKRFAHCLYVAQNKWSEDYLVVLDAFGPEPMSGDALDSSEVLFGPVKTMLLAAIRQGWLWAGIAKNTKRKIDLTQRSSLSLLWHSMGGPKQLDDWVLVGPDDSIEPVGILNPDQRRLEISSLYHPRLIVERIETGRRELDEFT